MKTLFALIAFTLVSQTASADFLEGRERPAALAKMEVLNATGAFSGTNEATVTQIMTDGDNRAKFAVVTNGPVKKLSFVSAKTWNTSCGNNTFAVSASAATMDIRLHLKDMTQALCYIANPDDWTVVIEIRDMNSPEVSTLELAGKPQFFYHTM
jgi:hypothetical protein